jgi:hypothetical protein
MVLLRCVFLASLAVALAAVAGSEALTADSPPPGQKPAGARSPDQQVTELLAKYQALPDKAQLGPEGSRILDQLKATSGALSPKSREAIARLEVSRNLRMIALEVHSYEDKDGKTPKWDPKVFSPLLPYIEQQPLPRVSWEYKVVTKGDIQKLGKKDFAAGLNKLGEQSWELVGFDKTRFIFKRQK